MRIVVVAIVVGAFATLVAGANATSDSPAVMLCISAQSYDHGRLSAPERSGSSCR